MPQPFLPARWVIASVDTLDDPNVFPGSIGDGFYALKTPVWSTAIATASTGRERRQQRWSYPRWSFKIPYEVLLATADTPEIQRLWAFYNMKGGPALDFYLRDGTDCVVSGERFGTGDGITTTFQLTRTMGTGNVNFTEPVLGVIGTPEVLISGTDTAAFTIGTEGKITFSAPPSAGAALTWTGQFYFRVRFADDQLDTSQVYKSAWASGGIALMTTKL